MKAWPVMRQMGVPTRKGGESCQRALRPLITGAIEAFHGRCRECKGFPWAFVSLGLPYASVESACAGAHVGDSITITHYLATSRLLGLLLDHGGECPFSAQRRGERDIIRLVGA